MTMLSYGLLVTALAMVTVQNLSLFVSLLTLQALILGAQSVVMGLATGEPHLFWAAALTIIVKGIAIPLFLRYIIRRIQVVRVLDSNLTTKSALLIALLLTLVSYFATSALTALWGAAAESLTVALAVVLIGVFLMVSRRVALTQAMGLLVMENGLFLAALSTTGGLPVLVDAGIIFDVLVTAVVTGLLVYRINTTLESIDTRELRRLRG